MTESTDYIGEFTKLNLSAREFDKINCPKHGLHHHTIVSTIEGHEGYWCQLCWLETLGESLPLIRGTR